MPRPAPPFSDPEVQAAAASKGGRVKAERSRLKRDDPEEYLRLTFEVERVGLTELLLDAAHGRKTFAGEATATCGGCGEEVTVSFPSLPPDKRLAAITKALEYAMGRPTTRDRPSPSGQVPATGLAIGEVGDDS